MHCVQKGLAENYYFKISWSFVKEEDKSVSVDWVTRQRPDLYWTRPTGKVKGLPDDAVYLHAWAACGSISCT